MKRAINDGGDPATVDDVKMKKFKAVEAPLVEEEVAENAETLKMKKLESVQFPEEVANNPETVKMKKLKSAESLEVVAENAEAVKMKILKAVESPEVEGEVAQNAGTVLLDENLLYEVLKHADARTLGSAACVSKQWHRTAQDERLWELICTRHWANTGCGKQQLRSVVLALGGFRRLHSLYLVPLSKPSISSSSSSPSAASALNWPCLPAPPRVPAKSAFAGKTRWGKDEVQLSLSLLSIRYYEKMNFSNRGK